MEFAKAQKYIARVSDSYYINDNQTYLLVKFELSEPDRISFAGGQYVSVRVGDNGERRSYSIVTTPDVNHGFTLVAEILPEGKGSEYLKKLKPGDTVEVLAPLGRFVVETEAKKLLFVATGSGIAPIYSMILDLLVNKKDKRPIRLNWGMRDENHLFWIDNFERLSEEYPYFVFDPVLSKPTQDWQLCNGHVQDCIKRDLSSENMTEWAAYICGNPQMVEEVAALVANLGIDTQNIHHEKFT